jgi:hypothetical protein
VFPFCFILLYFYFFSLLTAHMQPQQVFIDGMQLVNTTGIPVQILDVVTHATIATLPAAPAKCGYDKCANADCWAHNRIRVQYSGAEAERRTQLYVCSAHKELAGDLFVTGPNTPDRLELGTLAREWHNSALALLVTQDVADYVSRTHSRLNVYAPSLASTCLVRHCDGRVLACTMLAQHA